MALSTIPFSGLGADASNQGVNFRNLIINGDMSIAQRGTSATGQTSSGYKTVDRIRMVTGSDATFTVSQASETPTGQGFNKSFKVVATTGDNSLGSSQYNIPAQIRMEGQMLQTMKKGTSSAESVTFSFWVRATVTGTYILELNDDDNDRYISQSYTISTTNTWEKKTVTFAGDTTGAFDNDNAKSLTINFWGGAGTDFTSGSLATSWGGPDDTTRAVGQVNAFASNNDAWQITGLQMEVGTSASDFEFLPYDVNLQRCMRYLQQIGKNVAMNGNTPTGGNRLLQGQREASGSAAAKVIYYLPVPLRTNPTLSKTDINFRQDGTNTDFNSMSGSLFGGILELSVTNTSDFNVAKAMQVRCTSADSFIRFDSEL